MNEIIIAFVCGFIAGAGTLLFIAVKFEDGEIKASKQMRGDCITCGNSHLSWDGQELYCQACRNREKIKGEK